MLTLVIPVGVLEVIDRARRHCLWRRKDKEKINSLAAWDMVCKPKEKGGLGIINLKLQNAALLLKHLHKFYNNFDTPWVTHITMIRFLMLLVLLVPFGGEMSSL
jgi:hypothetical protein